MYNVIMTADEYLNKVESISDINSISDTMVSELIENLISVLPNQGKLYKYRTIDSNHYIDDLKCIYLPKVKKLNDKIDTTLNYRVSNDDSSIDKFYFIDIFIPITPRLLIKKG